MRRGCAACAKDSPPVTGRSMTRTANLRWTRGLEAWIIRQPMWQRPGSSIVLLFLLPALLALSACKPDDTPFRAENDALKKQLARQASLVTALQDGNKVMQQQIDLLNQEIRDAKKAAESAKAEAKAAAEQLEQQLVQARKLTADIKKTAIEQAAQSIHIDQKGAQFEDLPRPLNTVTKTVEEALARNGYQVRVSIKADHKAVIVTDRKISNPVSLEVAGFRNQYVIAVQAQPLNVTRLSVKAEIERRLIGEVSKALAAPSKT